MLGSSAPKAMVMRKKNRIFSYALSDLKEPMKELNRQASAKTGREAEDLWKY
jgi:hypothetical protein